MLLSAWNGANGTRQEYAVCGNSRRQRYRAFVSAVQKQSYEEFCLWGADFVYDYPPNLAQMKQSYASRKRMLLYRVIFQERIIGFAELDQIQENRSDAVLARVVLELERRGRGFEHSP